MKTSAKQFAFTTEFEIPRVAMSQLTLALFEEAALAPMEMRWNTEGGEEKAALEFYPRETADAVIDRLRWEAGREAY